MKKTIINISLIGLGIIGTISIQTYFPCTEQATTSSIDSTVVDSIKPTQEIISVVKDTIKTDTLK